MSKCTHPPEECHYYPDPHNEAGWECACGEKLGFRPDLDESMIDIKVFGLLTDLSEHGLISISNGTQGLVISSNVSRRCEREDRFDQDSILAFIISDPNLKSDGSFWREERRKWKESRNAA